MSEHNPQDIAPTFMRRDPVTKELIEVDVTGNPVKKAQADAQAAEGGQGEDAQGTGDTPPATDRRNIGQLTTALTAKGVQIPEGAKRDDLVKLAAEHGA